MEREQKRGRSDTWHVGLAYEDVLFRYVVPLMNPFRAMYHFKYSRRISLALSTDKTEDGNWLWKEYLKRSNLRLVNPTQISEEIRQRILSVFLAPEDKILVDSLLLSASNGYLPVNENIYPRNLYIWMFSAIRAVTKTRHNAAFNRLRQKCHDDLMLIHFARVMENVGFSYPAVVNNEMPFQINVNGKRASITGTDRLPVLTRLVGSLNESDKVDQIALFNMYWPIFVIGVFDLFPRKMAESCQRNVPLARKTFREVIAKLLFRETDPDISLLKTENMVGLILDAVRKVMTSLPERDGKMYLG